MQEDKDPHSNYLDDWQWEKDPYSNYDLYDWQWEFLRRNGRYRLRYRAIQRAKERQWGFDHEEKFLFIAENWAMELCEQLSLRNPPTIDDPDSYDHRDSLPDPNIPRHRFQYSP